MTSCDNPIRDKFKLAIIDLTNHVNKETWNM